MKRRRVLLVIFLVLLMLELTGQSGLFRASTLEGITYPNAPYQLAGQRVAFAGKSNISVACTVSSDNCTAMKRALEERHPDATIAVTIALVASQPSWCYAPFYKGGELTYEATVDLGDKAATKRIGMRGHVTASGFGIESCAFVRQFLVFLAKRDLRRQLNDAARQRDELLWKCSDGALKTSC